MKHQVRSTGARASANALFALLAAAPPLASEGSASTAPPTAVSYIADGRNRAVLHLMPLGQYNNLKEDTITSGVKGVVVANLLLKDIANIRGPEGGSTPTELATLLKDAELKFNPGSSPAPHDGSHLSQLFRDVVTVIKGRTLAAGGSLLSRSLDFFVALAKGIAPGVGAIFEEGAVVNSKKRKAGCTLHISRIIIRVGRANGDKAQIDEARGCSFHSLVSGGWSAIKICCVWAAAASNHTDYVLPLDHVRIAVEARAKMLYTVLVVTHVDADGRSLGQYAALMLVHAAAEQANLQSHGFGNGRPLADLIVPAAAARELDPAWLGEQRFKVESSSHSNACFSCGNALPDLGATVECMIIKGVSLQAFAPRDVDAAPGLADVIKYTCARLVVAEACLYPLSCVITADFQVHNDGESRHQPTADIPSLSQRMLVLAIELPRACGSAGNGADAADMSAQAAEAASLLAATRTKYAAEAYALMSKEERAAARAPLDKARYDNLSKQDKADKLAAAKARYDGLSAQDKADKVAATKAKREAKKAV